MEDSLLSVGLCLLYTGTSCGGFKCWVSFNDAFNVFHAQVSYSVEDSSVGLAHAIYAFQSQVSCGGFECRYYRSRWFFGYLVICMHFLTTVFNCNCVGNVF